MWREWCYATTEWVYSVLPASGDTAKYEGDSSSFAITIGSILIQGGIINIAPSAKDYWRSTFTFKKTFKVSPVVIGQFSASPFYKNVDGVSNVYVDTITNTSCNVVYDNAGTKRIGYAHIVAFGIA